MREVSFFVPGKPVPQGSLKSFPYQKKGGAGLGVSTPQLSKVLVWREEIQNRGLEAYEGVLDGITPMFPKGAPVHALLTFVVPKAKSNKHEHAVVGGSGDLDKLIRCVLDAATMLESEKRKKIRGNPARFIFDDDVQVVKITSSKVYASTPEEVGVHIKFIDLVVNESD